MSASKKKLAKVPATKPTICAGPPPTGFSRGKWKKRDGERFGRWWKRREETDALELKLTHWSDIGSPRRGGMRSLGDIFMMTAGASSSAPGRDDMGLHTVFHAIAAELEVMAAAELGKRDERQKSSDISANATDDLYAPLHYLAQRCRALGEIVPRIIRANYRHRDESEVAK